MKKQGKGNNTFNMHKRLHKDIFISFYHELFTRYKKYL